MYTIIIIIIIIIIIGSTALGEYWPPQIYTTNPKGTLPRLEFELRSSGNN
jgi:hypothetical protein